jgi:hypothetical protein
MVSDRIVACDPKILHSGCTGVPPTQHITGCQFVEEGGVGVDAWRSRMVAVRFANGTSEGSRS